MDRRRILSLCALAGALLRTGALPAQQPPHPAEAAQALERIAADEAARVRGDSAAWRRVAPAFVFVHSTGEADDLDSFQRWRAARRGAGIREPRTADVVPPLVRVEGDVLVRSRLLSDPPQPGRRPGQSRVLDVYVRRAGEWHWLAHQTGEVRARWAEVPVEEGTIEEYAGSYASADGTRRTFASRGGRLVQVAAAGERAMVPLSDATFGYEGLTATVTFVRDRSGRVVAADESSRVAFTRFAREAR